jgi:hypothetical protein
MTQDINVPAPWEYKEPEGEKAIFAAFALGYTTIDNQSACASLNIAQSIFDWHQKLRFHVSLLPEGARVVIAKFFKGPHWETHEPYAGPVGSSHQLPNGAVMKILAISNNSVTLSFAQPDA